jgi:hypothetical protein
MRRRGKFYLQGEFLTWREMSGGGGVSRTFSSVDSVELIEKLGTQETLGTPNWANHYTQIAREIFTFASSSLDVKIATWAFLKTPKV